MNHNKNSRKLGMSGNVRKAVFRNMADSLIVSGKIKTTLHKAKEIRKLAERLVTLAKAGTLSSKRKALTILRTKEAFKKLFSEYADKFKERNGGYTRIIKTESRVGDNAKMAFIEYLGNEESSSKTTKKKRKRRRSSGVKKEEKSEVKAKSTETKKDEVKKEAKVEKKAAPKKEEPKVETKKEKEVPKKEIKEEKK
jgi:large subunit ribosomal protein L17